MKYLILIYGNYEGWGQLDEKGMARIMAAHNELEAELQASGEYIESNELRAEGAQYVRNVGGETIVTDGPFVEGKEIVAGYYFVEVASVERAAEIAGRLVEAEFAPIEVRPVTSGATAEQ